MSSYDLTAVARSDDRAPELSRLERAGASVAALTSLKPANPLVRRTLYGLLAIAVTGAVALSILAAVGNLPSIRWRLAPGWLALGLAGLLALQICHLELWRALLRALGFRPDPARTRAAWSVSLLARYVPTSMLMPVVRAAMGETSGVPKRVTLAGTVYELALAFSAALAVGAYFVIMLPDLAGDPSRFAVLVVPVAAIAVLHPRVFAPLSAFALRRLGRPPLPSALPFRTLLGFAALYAATFVLAGASLLALTLALHPVASGHEVDVVGAFAVGYAISVAAFVLPAGLAAREAGLALLLSAAVPYAIGIAVAVLVRIAQIVIELSFAAVTTRLARPARRAAAA